MCYKLHAVYKMVISAAGMLYQLMLISGRRSGDTQSLFITYGDRHKQDGCLTPRCIHLTHYHLLSSPCQYLVDDICLQFTCVQHMLIAYNQRLMYWISLLFFRANVCSFGAFYREKMFIVRSLSIIMTDTGIGTIRSWYSYVCIQ